MIADIDLITNRIVLDFKDKKEFDGFIEFLEEAGYHVKSKETTSSGGKGK